MRNQLGSFLGTTTVSAASTAIIKGVVSLFIVADPVWEYFWISPPIDLIVIGQTPQSDLPLRKIELNLRLRFFCKLFVYTAAQGGRRSLFGVGEDIATLNEV